MDGKPAVSYCRYKNKAYLASVAFTALYVTPGFFKAF